MSDVCSVVGCGGVRRKREWCASHYAQQRVTGEPPKPFVRKWSPRTDCIVCGKPSKYGRRQFCSSACHVLPADRPTVGQCIACKVAIDFTAIGRGGQRKKVTTRFCAPCKRDYAKYEMSAAELALRDGTDCGICGEPVDMNLRRAVSNMCASVDHVLPRARGGTHDASNLQLAHLYCNQVKSDRLAPVPT